MFDLEREVAAWSRAAHADGCRNSASITELTDHLHCEIDRAQAEGMSDERAFAAAVAKLGSPTSLAAERAKNRSAFATACAWAARLEERGLGSGQRGLLIAHGVLWASLMIAVSSAMTRSGSRLDAAWVILGVIVPLWWCSEQILRRAMRRMPSGSAR